MANAIFGFAHPPPYSEQENRIDRKRNIESYRLKIKEGVSGKHCLQHAVWQDSGISPAETAVRTWKLLPRMNISEAATSPSRWNVVCHIGTCPVPK